jgi:hypothetical protein
MATRCGNDFATDWANAHEFGYPDNFGNADTTRATNMDFFNNNVGRYQGILWQNDKKAQANSRLFAFSLEKRILDRVSAGGLLRIINSKLVPTDSTGIIPYCDYNNVSY